MIVLNKVCEQAFDFVSSVTYKIENQNIHYGAMYSLKLEIQVTAPNIFCRSFHTNSANLKVESPAALNARKGANLVDKTSDRTACSYKTIINKVIHFKLLSLNLDRIAETQHSTQIMSASNHS